MRARRSLARTVAGAARKAHRGHDGALMIQASQGLANDCGLSRAQERHRQRLGHAGGEAYRAARREARRQGADLDFVFASFLPRDWLRMRVESLYDWRPAQSRSRGKASYEKGNTLRASSTLAIFEGQPVPPTRSGAVPREAALRTPLFGADPTSGIAAGPRAPLARLLASPRKACTRPRRTKVHGIVRGRMGFDP